MLQLPRHGRISIAKLPKSPYNSEERLQERSVQRDAEGKDSSQLRRSEGFVRLREQF
jgi:hypothetical protein